MIKKLFTIALLAATMGTQAQQVSDPGLENWQAGNPMA